MRIIDSIYLLLLSTISFSQDSTAIIPLHNAHAHNDYDLATANVYSAIQAGMDCIHTTVNGLGERAGNVH